MASFFILAARNPVGRWSALESFAWDQLIYDQEVLKKDDIVHIVKEQIKSGSGDYFATAMNVLDALCLTGDRNVEIKHCPYDECEQNLLVELPPKNKGLKFSKIKCPRCGCVVWLDFRYSCTAFTEISFMNLFLINEQTKEITEIMQAANGE